MFEPLLARRVSPAQSAPMVLRYGAASLWLSGLQWARLRKKRFWGSPRPARRSWRGRSLHC